MILVIFDIDGTLIYSQKVDSQSFATAYQITFGQVFPSINWLEYPHVTDETILETVFEAQFGRKPLEAEKNKLQDKFVEILQQSRIEDPAQFRKVPNSIATVKRLMEMQGYCVGIATGGWRRPATFKLQHVGLSVDDIFDAYADNNYTRPDIVNQSIAKAKAVHPNIERIVYVGDAPWDVRTTREMNLPLIGIRWRDDKEILERCGALDVLQDFSDFEAFMELVHTARVPKMV